MPRERKTNRGTWDTTDMENALDAIIQSKMSIREASSTYNVPKSTLHERAKAIHEGKLVTMVPKLGRFESTFTEEQENDLINYIIGLDQRLMPLSKRELLRLIFEYADKLKINHRFNKSLRIAGERFYQHFMAKHRNLSLRLAQNTSLKRYNGFTKEKVSVFFGKLRELYKTYNFLPQRIYNCDETGISDVHVNKKVISVRGKKTVGKLTSGERGRNTTIMFCLNATGDLLPPFFIFGATSLSISTLMKDAPPSYAGTVSKRGWMISETFLKWLEHFVSSTNASRENPVLLILDGYSAHKNLSVLQYAKENGVVMLSLPPHTSHKMQPLDITFMKPFKEAYNRVCSDRFRRECSKMINLEEVVGLAANAIQEVTNSERSVVGFKKTGIHPFNPHVFEDNEFAGNIEQCDTNNTNRKILEEALPMPSTVTKESSCGECSQILTSSPYLVRKQKKADQQNFDVELEKCIICNEVISNELVEC